MTHKFEIEVPTLVEHVKWLDTKNGDKYWRDAITKNMANFVIAFTIQEEGVNVPPG